MAELRQVVRDGEPQWKLRCPVCGEWGDIDDDQLHGRASVDHTTGFEGHDEFDVCQFHERRDWFNEAAAAEMER